MKNTLIALLTLMSAIGICGCNSKEEIADQNKQLPVIQMIADENKTQATEKDDKPEKKPEPQPITVTSSNSETITTYSKTYITGDEDFYYETLSDRILESIDGNSLADKNLVSANDLRYLRCKYVDLNGEDKKGELICNKAIADDLLDIFHQLYKNRYPIQQMKLAEIQGCDRNRLMVNNVTHCLNYTVAFNSPLPAAQAYGMGVYINPLFNPTLTLAPDNSIVINPIESSIYGVNTNPYSIVENDYIYNLFTSRGFIWGGSGINCKELGYFYKE